MTGVESTGAKIGTTAAVTVVIALVCAGVGFSYNALRSDNAIPFTVPDGFYDNKVFVPCPEVLTEPESVTGEKVHRWNPDRLLLVDAREQDVFEAAHHPGAVNFPYSVLFMPDPSDVQALGEQAGERTIIVCGDPEIESGRLLAADLLESGLEQVYYVEGGCPALLGAEMCTGEIE